MSATRLRPDRKPRRRALWWVQPLPVRTLVRTGFEPQPALPLALAVRSEALEAVLQVHDHLLDDCAPPLDQFALLNYVFNCSVAGSDLLPLVRDYPKDSRHYWFFMEWIAFNHLVYELGHVVSFVSEFGHMDVIDALLEDNGNDVCMLQ